MARKAEELYREALALSETERVELVRLLTGPGEGGFASPEIERAWIEECDRREQAAADGELRLIPGEEVFGELRKIIAE